MGRTSRAAAKAGNDTSAAMPMDVSHGGSSLKNKRPRDDVMAVAATGGKESSSSPTKRVKQQGDGGEASAVTAPKLQLKQAAAAAAAVPVAARAVNVHSISSSSSETKNDDDDKVPLPPSIAKNKEMHVVSSSPVAAPSKVSPPPPHGVKSSTVAVASKSDKAVSSATATIPDVNVANDKSKASSHKASAWQKRAFLIIVSLAMMMAVAVTMVIHVQTLFQLDDLTSQHGQLREENVQTVQLYEQTTWDLRSVKKQLAQLEKTWQDLSGKHEVLLAEKTQLKSDYSQALWDLRKVKREGINLVKQMEAAASDSDEMEAALAKAQTQIHALLAKMQELEEQRTKNEQERLEMQSLIARLEEQVAAAGGASNVQQTNNAYAAMMEEDFKKLHEDLDRQEVELIEQDATIEALKEERDELMEKLEAAAQELAAVHSSRSVMDQSESEAMDQQANNNEEQEADLSSQTPSADQQGTPNEQLQELQQQLNDPATAPSDDSEDYFEELEQDDMTSQDEEEEVDDVTEDELELEQDMEDSEETQGDEESEQQDVEYDE